MNSFDWKSYISNYEDLRKANINTKEKAWNHWINYGRKEGRNCNPSNPSILVNSNNPSILVNSNNPSIQTNPSIQKSIIIPNKIKIKYYSYHKGSGYGDSALAYVEVLKSGGIHVDSFIGVNYVYSDNVYDIVIIQTIPDHYPDICSSERINNKNIKIFGFTMWESDRIPSNWATIINSHVDYLIVPCEWNKFIFSKDVSKPIYVIHQVIKLIPMNIQSNIMDGINDSDYVFYTIGQWNARKRIDILIRAYLKTFTKTDNVVLFVKTFLNGYDDYDKIILSQHINYIINEFPNPARIIYNLDYINDNDIYSIHKRGNCFVSSSASEAIGLGLCTATLMNKRIIATGYGGQLEYLRDVDFIKYKIIPVKMCGYPPGHTDCNTNCIRYPWYNETQKWAEADNEHLCELMLNAYQNKLIGNESTKKFIEDNFNEIKIFNEFKQIIN